MSALWFALGVVVGIVGAALWSVWRVWRWYARRSMRPDYPPHRCARYEV